MCALCFTWWFLSLGGSVLAPHCGSYLCRDTGQNSLLRGPVDFELEAVGFAIVGPLKCLQAGRMRLRKQFEGPRRARKLFGSAQRAVVLRSGHARESVGAVVLGGERSVVKSDICVSVRSGLVG